MRLIGAPKKHEALHGRAFVLMEPSLGINPDLPTHPWVLRCTRKDEKECIVGIRRKLEIEPSWLTIKRANRNNSNCTRASRMRGCPSPIGYYGKLLGAQQIDWQRMNIGERAVARLYERSCGDNG